MLFHTLTFWIFFVLVALAYAALKHRGQNILLIIAGYIFYGWWDWRFLSLLIGSTLVDYLVASRMAASADRVDRRKWLVTSLVFNLALLGTFKYLGFATAQIGELMAWLGYQGPWWIPHIVLPVGISFYTFQSLSYTIEIYRGTTTPAKSLIDYAAYVSFFPQLLAGPIERPAHLLGQIQKPRPRLTAEVFREGLYYIILGLFRKVVIADNLSILVDAIFSRPYSELSAWEVLAGVYAFAFQIYGDFCGYSTMAQGISRWLGFELMDNFRHPYLSRSPQEFWRRWHISLSTWLRDYLYIPLGGNRGGTVMICRNLMITMLLGGLWHGASWTFIIWGGLHGAWLVIHRLLMTSRHASNAHTVGSRYFMLRQAVSLVKLLGTFHGVCLTWLFFRAATVEQAWGMLLRIFVDWSWTPLAGYALTLIVVLVVPLLLYELWVERQGSLLALTHGSWIWRCALYLLAIFALAFFSPQRPSEFIYFQF